MSLFYDCRQIWVIQWHKLLWTHVWTRASLLFTSFHLPASEESLLVGSIVLFISALFKKHRRATQNSNGLLGLRNYQGSCRLVCRLEQQWLFSGGEQSEYRASHLLLLHTSAPKLPRLLSLLSPSPWYYICFSISLVNLLQYTVVLCAFVRVAVPPCWMASVMS